MKKISKTDWLAKGLELLLLKGEQALRIDTLCQSLGVTKGSFYHHFANMDKYVSDLMAHWRQKDTLAIINKIDGNAAPKARLQQLTALAMDESHLTEIRLRAWSLRDPGIKKALDEVDQERLKYLTSVFEENGASAEEAEALAGMYYALLIGIESLFYNRPKQYHQKIFDTLDRLTERRP